MGKNRMLGEIKSHVDSCHSQQQLFRINKCFKQRVFLRINRVSPELICGTAGQTSPQTVDWLRSRIFHNVDVNSDSSLISFRFHYSICSSMEDTGATCNSFLYWTVTPLSGGITWHTFFFSFSCFQNKSDSEFALWWCSPRISGAPPSPWDMFPVCVCFCLHVCFKPKSACQKGPFTTPLSQAINLMGVCPPNW